MKRIKLFFITAMLTTTGSSFAQNLMTSSLNYNNSVQKHASKISFNYFAQYLGPSLDSNYQDGATYNRFKTGQDWKNDENDSTASTQLFHAITLGYQVNQRIKISYGYSFQEELNDKIEYQSKNLDGSYTTSERAKGISDNNKRVNVYVRNHVSNKYLYINANYFYELPSTSTSTGQDMNYGLGFEPSFNFYTNTPGLYTGITTSIQRNYYKRQQYDTLCGTTTCKYPVKYQTLLFQLGAYLNYQVSDKTTLTSSLSFDWDQDGDQIETNEFNKNMHDVARVGARFQLLSNMNAGTFFEFAIEDPSIHKSALGATVSINL